LYRREDGRPWKTADAIDGGNGIADRAADGIIAVAAKPVIAIMARTLVAVLVTPS
jgi:hypothetical protein